MNMQLEDTLQGILPLDDEFFVGGNQLEGDASGQDMSMMDSLHHSDDFRRSSLNRYDILTLRRDFEIVSANIDGNYPHNGNDSGQVGDIIRTILANASDDEESRTQDDDNELDYENDEQNSVLSFCSTNNEESDENSDSQTTEDSTHVSLNESLEDSFNDDGAQNPIGDYQNNYIETAPIEIVDNTEEWKPIIREFPPQQEQQHLSSQIQQQSTVPINETIINNNNNNNINYVNNINSNIDNNLTACVNNVNNCGIVNSNLNDISNYNNLSDLNDINSVNNLNDVNLFNNFNVDNLNGINNVDALNNINDLNNFNNMEVGEQEKNDNATKGATEAAIKVQGEQDIEDDLSIDDISSLLGIDLNERIDPSFDLAEFITLDGDCSIIDDDILAVAGDTDAFVDIEALEPDMSDTENGTTKKGNRKQNGINHQSQNEVVVINDVDAKVSNLSMNKCPSLYDNDLLTVMSQLPSQLLANESSPSPVKRVQPVASKPSVTKLRGKVLPDEEFDEDEEEEENRMDETDTSSESDSNTKADDQDLDNNADPLWTPGSSSLLSCRKRRKRMEYLMGGEKGKNGSKRRKTKGSMEGESDGKKTTGQSSAGGSKGAKAVGAKVTTNKRKRKPKSTETVNDGDDEAKVTEAARKGIKKEHHRSSKENSAGKKTTNSSSTGKTAAAAKGGILSSKSVSKGKYPPKASTPEREPTEKVSIAQKDLESRSKDRISGKRIPAAESSNKSTITGLNSENNSNNSHSNSINSHHNNNKLNNNKTIINRHLSDNSINNHNSQTIKANPEFGVAPVKSVSKELINDCLNKSTKNSMNLDNKKANNNQQDNNSSKSQKPFANGFTTKHNGKNGCSTMHKENERSSMKNSSTSRDYERVSMKNNSSLKHNSEKVAIKYNSSSKDNESISRKNYSSKDSERNSGKSSISNSSLKDRERNSGKSSSSNSSLKDNDRDRDRLAMKKSYSSSKDNERSLLKSNYVKDTTTTTSSKSHKDIKGDFSKAGKTLTISSGNKTKMGAISTAAAATVRANSMPKKIITSEEKVPFKSKERAPQKQFESAPSKQQQQQHQQQQQQKQSATATLSKSQEPLALKKTPTATISNSSVKTTTTTVTKHSKEVVDVVNSLRKEQKNDEQQLKGNAMTKPLFDPILEAKRKVERMKELKRAQQMRILDTTISAKVPKVTKLPPLAEIVKDKHYIQPLETTQQQLQLQAPPPPPLSQLPPLPSISVLHQKQSQSQDSSSSSSSSMIIQNGLIGNNTTHHQQNHHNDHRSTHDHYNYHQMNSNPLRLTLAEDYQDYEQVIVLSMGCNTDITIPPAADESLRIKSTIGVSEEAIPLLTTIGNTYEQIQKSAGENGQRVLSSNSLLVGIHNTVVRNSLPNNRNNNDDDTNKNNNKKDDTNKNSNNKNNRDNVAKEERRNDGGVAAATATATATTAGQQKLPTTKRINIEEWKAKRAKAMNDETTQHGENKIVMHLPKDRVRKSTVNAAVQTDHHREFVLLSLLTDVPALYPTSAATTTTNNSTSTTMKNISSTMMATESASASSNNGLQTDSNSDSEKSISNSSTQSSRRYDSAIGTGGYSSSYGSSSRRRQSSMSSSGTEQQRNDHDGYEAEQRSRNWKYDREDHREHHVSRRRHRYNSHNHHSSYNNNRKFVDDHCYYKRRPSHSRERQEEEEEEDERERERHHHQRHRTHSSSNNYNNGNSNSKRNRHDYSKERRYSDRSGDDGGNGDYHHDRWNSGSTTRSSRSPSPSYHRRKRTYSSQHSHSHSRRRSRSNSLARQQCRERFYANLREAEVSANNNPPTTQQNGRQTAYKYPERQAEERRIVFVGRLEDETNREELRRKFRRYGKICHISIHYKESGLKYGFVTFDRPRDAYIAIDSCKIDPEISMYDVNFGGRRAFCRASYEDLDNATDTKGFIGIQEGGQTNENLYNSGSVQKRGNVGGVGAGGDGGEEDSFEALLQKMKERINGTTKSDNNNTNSNKTSVKQTDL